MVGVRDSEAVVARELRACACACVSVRAYLQVSVCVCSLSPSSSLLFATPRRVLSPRAGLGALHNVFSPERSLRREYNVHARRRTVAAEGRAAFELRARQLAGRRPGGVRVVGVRDSEAVVASKLRACARACVTYHVP